MTSPLTAKGQVLSVEGSSVIFQPSGTNYELKLDLVGNRYDGPLNKQVDAVIRVKARKVYTVPSGGNFITPILGNPKILQGRVKEAHGHTIVLQCGTLINVELPVEGDSYLEQANGAIAVGSLVNVVCYAGISFDLVGRPIGA